MQSVTGGVHGQVPAGVLHDGADEIVDINCETLKVRSVEIMSSRVMPRWISLSSL